MLEGLTQMLGRAKTVNNNDAWDYAFKNNYSISNKIKEWILEQLDKGKDANNEIIGTYSFATERISNGRKKYNDPYNLKDTGKFRASIVVVPGKLKIDIFANGQKRGKNLIDEYGVEIIELMESNLEKLREIILKEYQNYAWNVLQLS